MNNLIISGRLTRDPQIRNNSGYDFSNFSIAVNNPYLKKGVEGATWFLDCTASGKTAEFVRKFLKKGSAVLLSGTLRYEQWMKDGQKHGKHAMWVDRIEFMGGKTNTHEKPLTPVDSFQTEITGELAENFDTEISDDELPF